jgi:hypothetical protein
MGLPFRSLCPVTLCQYGLAFDHCHAWFPFHPACGNTIAAHVTETAFESSRKERHLTLALTGLVHYHNTVDSVMPEADSCD